MFAGYGISAPTLNYDDYEGLDVRGKAVVIFMHEPQENDDEEPVRRPRLHTAREPDAEGHGGARSTGRGCCCS